MSFSIPIQWYHFHADPIWPDGTVKSSNDVSVHYNKEEISRYLFREIQLMLYCFKLAFPF